MTLSFYQYYPFVLVLYFYNKGIYLYHKHKQHYQFFIKKQNVPSLCRGQDNPIKKLMEMVKTKLKKLFPVATYSNNNTSAIKFCKRYSHVSVFSCFYFGANSNV